jgi:hypothetical protein
VPTSIPTACGTASGVSVNLEQKRSSYLLIRTGIDSDVICLQLGAAYAPYRDCTRIPRPVNRGGSRYPHQFEGRSSIFMRLPMT